MQRTLYDIRMELWRNSYQHWVSKELFSLSWFIAVLVIAACYVILIKFSDKKRLKDLLLFGSLVAVAAALVDTIGVTLGLWEYTIRLFPISPAVFPFDYTIVPILYIFVFQYSTSWKSYLLYSLLASAFDSFVVNILYIYLGILKYHKFNVFYMFLSIFILTTLLKVIYNWIDNIQNKNSGDNKGSEVDFQNVN